jgi:transposase InsO family protein
MGRKRTELQVQRRGYWPGWTSDVRQFLKRCSPCAQYQRGAVPRITPLNPMISGDVWERISIDITGPHPRSRRGNIYLLTVVDHFSKWSDAFPLPNHNAVTVATKLFERVFSVFGPPLQLLSDRGAEFESLLMHEICKWLGIHELRTTGYKPSTNEIVERYHRSLNSILAKIVAEDQRDWCERVPIATAAYRASTHEVTGYSPNFLMFGRENRAPIDIILGLDAPSENEGPSPVEFVELKRSMMREVYRQVRQHLGVAANRRKDYYDTKVKSSSFAIGQWVWYLYQRRRVGISPKWQRHCIGPYLIVRVISLYNLVIQKSKRSKPFVVHRDKLKPFVGDAPPSWLATESDVRPPRVDCPGLPNSGAGAGSVNVHTDPVLHLQIDEISPADPSTEPAREPGSEPTANHQRLRDTEIAAGGPDLLGVAPSPKSVGSPSSNSGIGRPKRQIRKSSRLTNFVCSVARETDEMRNSTASWNQPRVCPVQGCGKVASRADSLRRHSRLSSVE